MPRTFDPARRPSGPGGKGRASSLQRGYPPEEVREAPHCLLSPVLDTPLLLSRERPFLIGRDPAVDVRIKSDLVSRRHSEIRWDGKGYLLKDLGSLNGTTVNGVRLKGPCVLHDEDRLGFGGFEFVLRVLTGGGYSFEEKGGTTKIYKGEADWTANNTPSFAGDLARLALKDVLEIVEWKRHSGTLTINPDAGERGYLYFQDGTLVHAETRSTRGPEAAYALLPVRRGEFSFKHARPSCPVTIEVALEELWARVRGP